MVRALVASAAVLFLSPAAVATGSSPSLRGSGSGSGSSSGGAAASGGCRPLVALVGPAIITHRSAAGFVFHDPGARCADGCWGIGAAAQRPAAWWRARPAAATWQGGKPFNDKLPGSYTRRYSCYDPRGGPADTVVVATATRTFHVIDKTPPTLTLVGPAAMTVAAVPSAAAGYRDRGAVCEDYVDGDLSATVQVRGDRVQLDKPGAYTVSYVCSDISGNVARATRTVTVRAAAGGGAARSAPVPVPQQEEEEEGKDGRHVGGAMGYDAALAAGWLMAAAQGPVHKARKEGWHEHSHV